MADKYTKQANLAYSDVVKNQAGLSNDQIASNAQSLTDVSSQIPKADLQSFQKANPGQVFNNEDLQHYNAAQPKQFSIPVQDITPAMPLTLPQPSTDVVPAQSMVAGAKQTGSDLQSYIDKLQAPKTALDTQNDSLTSMLSQLYGEDVGQAKATADAQQAAGIPNLQKQYADLNAQILRHSAEYDQLSANQELNGRGVPFSVVQGQQGAIQRSKAADIGLLQARALGLQGQIQQAKDTVAQAIDLKYKSKEEEITAKEKQLALIKPSLDKEEAKTAKAQELMLADEKQKLADLKEKSKANVDLAFQSGLTNRFINKGGEFFRASDGKPYDNVEEFLTDAGVDSIEQAYAQGLIGDVNNAMLQDLDFVAKLRETYPDAGIAYGDSADTAVTKLGQSNKYINENAVDSSPKPITVNGQTYFQDPSTGSLVPASAFVEGGVQNSQNKYISNDGSPLKLAATEVDSLAGFDSAQIQADMALKLLADGVKTGPVAKLDLAVNKWFGTQDPKQNQLDQTIAQLKADFQKAISGANVTEQESKRLSAFLPSISDQESVIREKLQSLKINLAGKKQAFLEAKGAEENPNFSSAGNASVSTGNVVKGVKLSADKIPLLTGGIENNKAVPLTAAYPQGAKGGQCGIWVRSIVNQQGLNYPPVGDSLKEKEATGKKYGVPVSQGKIGSVVLTNESKENGHVAYVIGISQNPPGFKVAESNYHLNGKVDYGRVIPYDSNKIIGVINPTKKG